MKNTALFILIAIAAMALGACAPAANTPANNTAATPAKAAAPTKEALFAMDKKANEAWIKGDKAHFEGMLSDKFVHYSEMGRMDKAGMLAMIGSMKCDEKTTFSLSDEQMSRIDDDTYVLTYKGEFNGSCTDDKGKSMKLPSPVRAASVWVRSGNDWKGAFHSETLIVAPKTDAKADDKAKADAPAKAEDKSKPQIIEATASDAEEEKKAAAKSEATTKKADNVTRASAKDATKASDAAKTDADSKSGTTTRAATPSANTEALVKLHNAGWEAFKNKDAKAFETMLTSDFSFVDPMGGYHAGRANVIRIWTEGMNCQGITKVAFTDGFATALSPTVEILTGKGTADGTCMGEKNGELYQSNVYVKEGSAWKLAFMIEAPPTKKK